MNFFITAKADSLYHQRIKPAPCSKILLTRKSSPRGVSRNGRHWGNGSWEWELFMLVGSGRSVEVVTVVCPSQVKLRWTQAWRRQNKKGKVEEGGKKKARKAS